VDVDLTQLVGAGPACIVAGRDDRMRPEIARGWAPELAPDGASGSVCVGVARDSRLGSNLAANGSIAVTMSHAANYRGVQLKGQVTSLADPNADDLARVEAHMQAFVAAVEPVGLTEAQMRRLLTPELIAVTFTVDEMYDQTPGPRAGARL
jgi:hypothetical protein